MFDAIHPVLLTFIFMFGAAIAAYLVSLVIKTIAPNFYARVSATLDMLLSGKEDEFAWLSDPEPISTQRWK